MSRPVRYVFLALALALVLFPATVAKPGQPMTLRSDEPAYYLMALSLARDCDLRCDLQDIQRLAVEYPYQLVDNLILMSADGWKSVYFGKPWLISLIAAPATAAFGAGGFVATNMALLLLSIWLGALYLRRFNPEWLALLFSAGFFVLSNAWVYVFWLHTEVLCIAAITASLYLGLTPANGSPALSRFGRAWSRIWNESTRPAFSGAAIVVAAYNKPVLGLLGFAALYVAARGRGMRGAASWLSGAVVTGLLLCGISLALTPTASAYLGAERQGVRVETFDRMPDLPEPTPPDPNAGPRNAWNWIFRTPEIDRRLPENLGYFFVGRHTGLFPYAPFTLVALLLFLAFERRSKERWILAASLAGVALFFLTLIPFNWHGGGGFVGNRYFVNALPGFLFLVTRIAPNWLALAGFALGGLFVGPLVFSPYGAIVPSPTLQAHVRNRPFQWLPLEMTIRSQIPGYRGYGGAGGVYILGRDDVFRPVGDALWVAGGVPVELVVQSTAPLVRPVFQVATITAPNRVRLDLGSAHLEPHFQTIEPPGNLTRLTLAPNTPSVERTWDGVAYYSYDLVVHAETQAWHYEVVPTRNLKAVKKAIAETDSAAAGGRHVPGWEEQEIEMLVGAIVTYLGEEDELAWDLFAIDWLDVPMPPVIRPGATLQFRARVRNASGQVWRHKGATRVALAYHWFRPDGSRVEWDGLRSMFKQDVAPGETVELDLEIEAPKAPGSYVIELDAVREQIAWFSERKPGSTLRRAIEVTPQNP